MIQSDRLIFREINEKDFAIIAKIMRDEGVQKIWEHYFSDDDIREWIEKRKSGYQNNGIDYLLAINRHTQEVVGQIGLLKETIEGEIVWAIGYILMSEHHGNGYATEGANAMINYAFHILKAPKIICEIRPINKSSIAVAKRLSMTETGSFTKIYRGIEMPHLIFELDNK
jgi:RimJ/RimL family protein N-acetyltransferase